VAVTQELRMHACMRLNQDEAYIIRDITAQLGGRALPP